MRSLALAFNADQLEWLNLLVEVCGHFQLHVQFGCWIGLRIVPFSQ